MKKILEVFPDRRVLYQMPPEVYEVLMGAYRQTQRISSDTTIEYIVQELPPELRLKIVVKRINNIDSNDLLYVDDASLVLQWGRDFDL